MLRYLLGCLVLGISFNAFSMEYWPVTVSECSFSQIPTEHRKRDQHIVYDIRGSEVQGSAAQDLIEVISQNPSIEKTHHRDEFGVFYFTEYRLREKQEFINHNPDCKAMCDVDVESLEQNVYCSTSLTEKPHCRKTCVYRWVYDKVGS